MKKGLMIFGILFLVICSSFFVSANSLNVRRGDTFLVSCENQNHSLIVQNILNYTSSSAEDYVDFLDETNSRYWTYFDSEGKGNINLFGFTFDVSFIGSGLLNYILKIESVDCFLYDSEFTCGNEDYSCFLSQDCCEDLICLSNKCIDPEKSTTSQNKPNCSYIGRRAEGWYREGRKGLVVIDKGNCEGCEAICLNGGTDEEGWYSSCDKSLIILDDCEVEPFCFDSEETTSYYEKGFITNLYISDDDSKIYKNWDLCLDDDTLMEASCDYYLSSVRYPYREINCPAGCKDGRCYKTMEIQTGESSLETEEEILDNSTIGFSYASWTCYDGVSEKQGDDNICKTSELWKEEAREFCEDHCNQDVGKCGVNSFSLIKECSGAVSVDLESELGETLSGDEGEDEENQENNQEGVFDDDVLVCEDSCLLDETCYDFGYRKEGMFCSDNGDFLEQYSEDEDCENNFECESNVCVSGKCLSGSFIQKIIEWVKSFFGTD